MSDLYLIVDTYTNRVMGFSKYEETAKIFASLNCTLVVLPDAVVNIIRRKETDDEN